MVGPPVDEKRSGSRFAERFRNDTTYDWWLFGDDVLFFFFFFLFLCSFFFFLHRIHRLRLLHQLTLTLTILESNFQIQKIYGKQTIRRHLVGYVLCAYLPEKFGGVSCSALPAGHQKQVVDVSEKCDQVGRRSLDEFHRGRVHKSIGQKDRDGSAHGRSPYLSEEKLVLEMDERISHDEIQDRSEFVARERLQETQVGVSPTQLRKMRLVKAAGGVDSLFPRYGRVESVHVGRDESAVRRSLFRRFELLKPTNEIARVPERTRNFSEQRCGHSSQENIQEVSTAVHRSRDGSSAERSSGFRAAGLVHFGQKVNRRRQTRSFRDGSEFRFGDVVRVQYPSGELVPLDLDVIRTPVEGFPVDFLVVFRVTQLPESLGSILGPTPKNYGSAFVGSGDVEFRIFA